MRDLCRKAEHVFQRQIIHEPILKKGRHYNEWNRKEKVQENYLNNVIWARREMFSHAWSDGRRLFWSVIFEDVYNEWVPIKWFEEASLAFPRIIYQKDVSIVHDLIFAGYLYLFQKCHLLHYNQVADNQRDFCAVHYSFAFLRFFSTFSNWNMSLKLGQSGCSVLSSAYILV